VIVVLGRPGLDERGALDRLAGAIAAAAMQAGIPVELVGSVADDATGDATITELGRRGIGHAAVLRMPANGDRDGDRDGTTRLDAADIELGLRYVNDCRVLVVADRLDEAGLAAAIGGARYHSAQLVLTAAPGAAARAQLPVDATVLESPDEDEGAFAQLVGRYAAQLDAGRGPADAWRDAVAATGWEQSERAEDEA
jgi:hypothetical protein